jgi:prepilin-type N-terminal cleavage/methylation domain-containing protein
MNSANARKRAFSLTELLVTIAIVGALTAAVIPVISNLHESSTKAKHLANAKNIERMSAALASLGVAHVIPDSMGGVEATARLFREGVVVPEGPMAGESFRLNALSDEDISELGNFLRVQYDMQELRLVMKPHTTSFTRPSPYLYCFKAPRHPVRIEVLDLELVLV